MKYLLDTHTAIWALENNNKLSNTVKGIILEDTLSLCASIASAWEIAIKISIGKLKFDGGSTFFLDTLRMSGVEIVPIKDSYVACVEKLPLYHRDPFDRILITTAMRENLIVLTNDDCFSNYEIQTLW